jgi:DnaK suppressor protein
MTNTTSQERGRAAAEVAQSTDQAQIALEALKQRLYEDVAALRQQDDDRTPYGGDFESLVTAAQLASQQETDELLRRRLERRLAELDRVTRRVEQGQYGVCESCGAEIPAERLAAIPDTTLCVRCQSKRERPRTGRRAA